MSIFLFKVSLILHFGMYLHVLSSVIASSSGSSQLLDQGIMGTRLAQLVGNLVSIYMYIPYCTVVRMFISTHS